MKRILILGVNGFIGHHLSKRILADTDWDVYGMDMQSDRIEDVLDDPRFHFFEGDITINKEWIEYHIRKWDTVLPLGAIPTPATYAKEAPRGCPWSPSPRRRATGRSGCASSNWTSRRTCRSFAPACATASAWSSRR